MAPEEIHTRFCTRTLTHADWDHHAHLVVCWYEVRRLGRDAALEHLRHEIAEFNGSIGVENTPTSGYHETLTRYFVDAVADANAGDPRALFDNPSCRRDAPMHHWTREVLFSTRARAEWVAPDRHSIPSHNIEASIS